MLAGHPLIDRLLPFDAETLCHLDLERFDVCLSLDKEAAPAGLAMRVAAADKRGLGLSPWGTVYPLNDACRHYFALGLDDALKFRGNTASYQQLIYEAVGLDYRGERYQLFPSRSASEAASAVWRRSGVRDQDLVIGLNTGAGPAFANKIWKAPRFAELIEALRARLATRPDRRLWFALFGGPAEQSLNTTLAETAADIIDTGVHDEQTFAALLARANVLVTGDTMALHVGIAMQAPCVAIFGPTCAAEIDLYGRGEKIVSTLGCSPCYRRVCDLTPTCMDELPLDRVVAAVLRWAHPTPGSRPDACEQALPPAPAARALPVLEPLAATAH